MEVSDYESVPVTRKQFGLLVQKHRKAKGYSQEAFAEMLGISQKSVSCIERGACFPSQENIFKIAFLLNISLDEFLFGYKISDSTISLNEIIALLNALTAEQKIIVLGTLKKLTELLRQSTNKPPQS